MSEDDAPGDDAREGRPADVPPSRPTGDGKRRETGDDAGRLLEELFAVIESRRETLPEDSYTASLFEHEKGENRVLEKLGEETTELVLAAKDDDREGMAHEAADIVYHLLVLLAMKDMTLEDLLAELEARR